MLLELVFVMTNSSKEFSSDFDSVDEIPIDSIVAEIRIRVS